MKTIIKIFLLVVYLVTVNISIAQVSDEIENGIYTSLLTKYGDKVSIGSLVDVNEQKNKYQQWGLSITDPYETLKDCYVFAANVEAGGLVGVYKNSNLLWDSEPTIDLDNINLNIQIIGTSDINNDGNVEIMAAWEYGVTGFIQNIWIFSWNSSTGTLLNETVEGTQENTYLSVLWSYSYLTDILDVDGDNVYEIKGVNEEDTDQTKIYSWDGHMYGDFGVTLPQDVPMNLLTATVKCKVNKSQYGLLYNYSVENAITSQQSIRIFAVTKPFEYVKVGSGNPNEKWYHYYPDNLELLSWKVDTDLQKFPFDYLIPGETLSNYKLETDAEIIYIDNYYAQGKNGEINPSSTNVLENSFNGKTICGRNAFVPFIPLDFIDTLSTYTDSSYALGWIETEEAKNKYNTYFNSAKMYLQQTDTASAKAELELVLNECNVDSSTVLTSEAYALLYFNTEYLIEQLPNTDPLPVELSMFVGEVVDTTVVLHWQTATEINNYGFSVEQNSILFPDWKEIGFIEGHGNSYSPKEYTYTDSLVTTTSNYRLKIIDTNGGYKYSKTITVIIE